MISNLRIESLGIIEEADIELAPGMIAFTGETGAGKTMLTHALGLVFGDRADYGLVQSESARVEARIRIDPNGEAMRLVDESGGSLDDGELVVARSLTASGRSRAYAGGRSVPAATLAAMARELASRHSQNDQIRLRQSARQRQALDEYAGDSMAERLRRYRSDYTRYVTLARELAEWQSHQRELGREAAVLQQSLTEIAGVDPETDELEQINVEIARLANSESLREATQTAYDAISGAETPGSSPGAMTDVATALAALQRVGHMDPALRGSLGLLDEAQSLLNEVSTELAQYKSALDGDPGRLDELQIRKSQLSALCRKYGDNLADVIDWASDARSRLSALDPDGIAQSNKREELNDLAESLAQVAQQISGARSSAAQRLSAAVTAELADLSMPSAKLHVVVNQREDVNGLTMSDGRVVSFGENGVDVVQLTLQPHPGVDPTPLGEGASGGEMSRIMLAIEVVLAESSPPRVFVFDEIDAGVGGRAAIEVGRRLARLATRSQVLVVTHLPQVASFADQQIVVSKDSAGQVTRTSVVESTGTDRVRELSRMLSGMEGSTIGLRHAEELLEVAAMERDRGIARVSKSG